MGVQPDVPDNLGTRVAAQQDVSDTLGAQATGFRSGSAGTSKSQITPPLDLSEGRRLVESPLDLSVKTRKRCADTTDYEDMIGRGGVLPDAAMAKRPCLSKQFSPGHMAQTIAQENAAAEKQMAEVATMSRLAQHHKHQQQHQQQQQHHQQQLMVRKMTPGSQKYSSGNSIQMSPTAIQQHEMERHIAQQSRQMQLLAPAQTMRPHPSPTQYSPHLASPQQASLQRRQSSPYEMSHPIGVQMPLTASQTESVALKGFFEPTHKVTVNAASNQAMGPVSRSSQQHVSMPQIMSTERALSHSAARSMVGMASEHKVHEEHRQPTASYPHTSVYQRCQSGRMVSSSLARSPSGGGQVNELELLQHRQYPIQQSNAQRHYQREHSQAQKSPLPHSNQEQQRLAMMMEMQKQESHKRQYPEKDAGMSPYSNTIVRHVAFPEGSIRHEKQEMSVRCMKVGQPVPLPEIHQAHAQTLERVQAVPSHSDLYRSRQVQESRQYIDTVAVSTAMGNSVRNLPPSASIRYETNARLRHPDQYEKHLMPGIPSTEIIPMHPSVIQRPQGYIPPRIVRRESADTAPNRRPSERDRMHQSQSVVHADFNSEQVSVRHEMSVRGNRSHYGPSRDILSGRDVLRIQQRAAEQRHNEMHLSTKHHSKPVDSIAGEGLSYSERRRSLTESNSTRPHSGEGTRSATTSERARLISPPGRDIPNHSGPSSSKDLVGPVQSPRASSSYSGSSGNTHQGRSITKGTSGMNKVQHEDLLSQILMRELKKPNDDDEINPFANRSLLQEFERSSTNSPSRSSAKPSQPEVEACKQVVVNKSESVTTIVKESVETVTSKSDSSYTLPLQIAIPGHKTNAQASGSSERTSVIANVKQEPPAAVPPKPQRFMSRKQMILSAFRQEEDLHKNTVDIDKDEKVPMESSKYASMKLEKDSSHCPPSPKMPILSPQERSRNTGTPIVSPAPVEQQPPNLENLSSSSNGSPSSDKGQEKMKSLEEHLHRMISNALNKDSKESNDVVEAISREIQTQGHKLFVTRQSSITRNIPVANVAPIVHGKVVSETTDSHQDDTTKDDSETQKTECVETDIDDEDAKIAEVVTRSIFGDRFDTVTKSEQREQIRDKTKELNTSAIENSQELKNESPFEENSESLRMSPGLKKLMLYRHRDSGDSTNVNSGFMSSQDNLDEFSGDSVSKCSESTHKRKKVEKNRNVFGALNKLVAEEYDDRNYTAVSEDHTDSIPDVKRHQKNTCWTGYPNEEDDNTELVSFIKNTELVSFIKKM